ncbi:hypothetical protein RMATCC62417_07902 [Rhizopus microsporus]|nr:hypothetical protein RMATCC62417_07902 [Rhizopus microsporus]
MAIKSTLRKYAPILIASLFTLFIPAVLYSLRQKQTLSPQQTIRQRAYSYPSMVRYSYHWPNTKKEIKERVDKEELKRIDRAYCGRDRCKFILPIVITEQESKAQMHFRQLAFLAGKIGRTIVLPNVYNSHLGACLPYPFDFYYDQEAWAKENERFFNYITMDDFKAWISERQAVGVDPTAQEIFVQGTQKSKLLAKFKNCFRSSFDFSDRPIANYQLLDISHPTQKDGNITQTMMSLLSDEAREHEYLGNSDKPVDVINLFYDRRFKFIENPEAQKPVPYSPVLVKMADDISSQLRPYMAIHWRMERLEPVSNLLPCAKDLIEKIHEIDPSVHKHPNVFLLTDYPHLLNTTGARPESSSFTRNQLKPEHHEAIRHLYQHLNITLTSTNNLPIPYDELPKQNWNILTISTGKYKDRSVLGIIDKLVAIKAQWFFAGKPGVCAKTSSFTGRISLSRLNAFRHGDKNIVVPLQTFNLPQGNL